MPHLYMYKLYIVTWTWQHKSTATRMQWPGPNGPLLYNPELVFLSCDVAKNKFAPPVQGPSVHIYPLSLSCDQPSGLFLS